MKRKKLLSLLLTVATAFVLLTGCSTANTTATQVPTMPAVTAAPEATPEAAIPKYVFLFIGDGMTYPQVQLASAYLGALDEKDDILSGGELLSFMDFPVAGSATTYDSTSFCPDSASTATSIASGYKTYSGVINMDETKTKSYTTITEQLKAEKDYKIGVISTVNLNHATPAAFYAHQASRNNYYEIALEMVESGFDYFAGGALKNPAGNDKEKPQEDVYEIAKKSGYTVAKTQAEAEALKAGGGKAIVISEVLADSDAMSYEIDRADGEWGLSDYVKQGIELLTNDTGFFMMVEGGKIDWACHANDAGSTIMDTLAMDDAIKVALEFAQQHPDETLILVTGDHETGGLSIGFAGTDYATYLDNIILQKISYAKYDTDYVKGYVENKTPFEDAMKDVETLFGLVMPEKAASVADKTLLLTDFEVSELQKAYTLTLAGGFGTDANGKSLQTQDEYVTYGTYTPFSVTVTHLLNNKSGINFASYAHTGLPAAVFASGVGAESFVGSYDNTDIYYKMAALFNI
jgi:alkaline phosphatase